ncbi:MAG: rod shape-determining protein MreD [Rikenellaceae bacterium]|nr:rod shape-determining protein MreD [Rikenellaceae bacterium]MCL2692856.1 rod shape-determining protein MreD [Rikenellaceae bacterium]
MHRFFEYLLFFVVLMLLQMFLFNNLSLSMYIHPLVYVAFIVLLPMEMATVWVLLLGFATGVVADMTSGGAGLNTIATLPVAFLRRQVMMLMIGKESVDEGGVPSSSRVGAGKFLRYAAMMILLHALVFFTFEVLTFSDFHLVLFKTVAGSAVTLALVYVSQSLLIGAYGKRSTI